MVVNGSNGSINRCMDRLGINGLWLNRSEILLLSETEYHRKKLLCGNIQIFITLFRNFYGGSTKDWSGY